MSYILDSVMTALASDFDEGNVDSLNFSVSYLNGISADTDSFLVHAKVVKGGRAMAFLSAELRSLPLNFIIKIIIMEPKMVSNSILDLKMGKSTRNQKRVLRRASNPSLLTVFIHFCINRFATFYLHQYLLFFRRNTKSRTNRFFPVFRRNL